MLTVSQVRTMSSQDRVEALSDPQVQAALDVCKQLILSLGVNPMASGYDDIFDAAQFVAFEWFIANPTTYTELEQGRLRARYSVELPPSIRLIVKPILLPATGIGSLVRPGGN